MPANPNKLSQFWQELKRRRVIHVIIVYASVSFVIIELINNITEPLSLPDWTPTLIIIILLVGFPLAIIFSWIFDVTPEGIEKTKPAHKEKTEDMTKSSERWRIASYISFVVIVGLIVLNIIPRNKRSEVKEILDKSIAVLPFHNDSPDKENEYFINGTMESILNNLCKIEDLRVVSRSTVEQYRDTVIYIPDVTRKMMVSYVLEGSMQKYGDRIRLSLQLIDLNDNHVWSEQYDREIHKVEDIIDIQSEIAQLVAGELKALITPEERQLIEKIPTSSLTAYDFCQKGLEEHTTFLLDRNDIGALDRALEFYQKALNTDSHYAEAYAALAFAYLHKHELNHLNNCLDSALIFADIALSYDDQSTLAYNAKGWYYINRNQRDLALHEFNEAIILAPNDYLAYEGKAWVYWSDKNYIEAIENLENVISIDRGRLLPDWLRSIGDIYCFAGFLNKAQYYYEEAVKLDNDSITYYIYRGSSEQYHGNYSKAIEILQKGSAYDSLNHFVLIRLAYSYMLNDQNEEFLECIEKYRERKRTLGESNPLKIDLLLVGYYYWQKGYYGQAKFHFNEGIMEWEEIIRSGNLFDKDDAYMKLSAVNAFIGEENQAFEYLRILNQKPRMPVSWSLYLRNNPLFDPIRSRPEFQQIIRDVEARYQAEHERVRQWLEENEMI